jgi:hypothetical protein
VVGIELQATAIASQNADNDLDTNPSNRLASAVFWFANRSSACTMPREILGFLGWLYASRLGNESLRPKNFNLVITVQDYFAEELTCRG